MVHHFKYTLCVREVKDFSVHDNILTLPQCNSLLALAKKLLTIRTYIRCPSSCFCDLPKQKYPFVSDNSEFICAELFDYRYLSFVIL